MNITKREFLAGTAAAAAVLAAPTILRAQGTMTLRIAHSTSSESSYSKAANFFGKRVGELTNGEIGIREYGGATLGTETSTLDLYEAGDIDMGFHFTSAMAPAVPKLGFLDVPFLFQDLPHWERFALSADFKTMFDGMLEEANKPYRAAVIGLSGARNVYTRSVILDDIAKFEGLKLRLPESAVAAKLWRALGTIPTAVPWADAYAALETGLVEGAENTPNWYFDARHIEVAKNYHYTNHLVGTAIMLIGTGTMSRIPAEMVPHVEQALSETSKFWLETQIAADERTIKEEFDANGVNQVQMSPEIMTAIQDRAAPLKSETAAEFEVASLLDLIEKSR